MGTTRQWSLKEAGNISGGGGVGHNDWFIVCDFWREEEMGSVWMIYLLCGWSSLLVERWREDGEKRMRQKEKRT